MSSLATFVLTKNEAYNLVEVVENAKNCLDDVITIDSDCKDKTVALADVQGATVCFRARKDPFAGRDNFALRQTKADVAHCLDGDERLHERLIEFGKVGLTKVLLMHQSFMERKSVTFGRTFNLSKLCSHEGGIAGV